MGRGGQEVRQRFGVASNAQYTLVMCRSLGGDNDQDTEVPTVVRDRR
jgi:hypothetical protein